MKFLSYNIWKIIKDLKHQYLTQSSIKQKEPNYENQDNDLINKFAIKD